MNAKKMVSAVVLMCSVCVFADSQDTAKVAVPVDSSIVVMHKHKPIKKSTMRMPRVYELSAISNIIQQTRIPIKSN